MNMQNKLYIIHFFSPPIDRFAIQKKFKLSVKRGLKLPEYQKNNSFLHSDNLHS